MKDSNFSILKTPEEIILIMGPCRSGTTSLLNCFSMGGISGVYQPIKAAVRREHYGDKTPVIIGAGEKQLVVKETFGPYFGGEVHYDPINTLLQNGVSQSSIKVIALYRKPTACLDSWFRTFRKNDLDITLFGSAYEATRNYCSEAQEKGIHVVSIRYESLGDEKVFRDLAKSVGLPFAPHMLNWETSPYFRSGSVAYEDVYQPGQDKCTEKVKGSKGFRVPALASTPIYFDQEVAQKAGLAAARDIYRSIPSAVISNRSPTAMIIAKPRGSARAYG